MKASFVLVRQDDMCLKILKFLTSFFVVLDDKILSTMAASSSLGFSCTEKKKKEKILGYTRCSTVNMMF